MKEDNSGVCIGHVPGSGRSHNLSGGFIIDLR